MARIASTRRVDGKPETEADRKFFDLRESGYTGPIDQNGDMVTDPETLAIFARLSRTNAQSR
jgi:hypothetical protein